MVSADTGTVTDTELVRRLGVGEVDALAALYDRFASRVHSLALRICVDPRIAQDVCQEVFLVLWRRPDRFDPTRGALGTWLLTVAHHKAVDAVRQESTVRRHTVPLADDDRTLPTAPGADQGAVGSVVAREVRVALAELPVEQRHALALAYYGGYSQQEVAAIMGIPLGTVKSRTFAAMARLRVRLAALREADQPGMPSPSSSTGGTPRAEPGS